MNSNEAEIKQMMAALIHSFEGAIEIIAGAVAREGDAGRLHTALQKQIAIAESGKLVSPLAIRLATSALAAVKVVHFEKSGE